MAVFFSSLALAGCAGWINPYASDFTCPKTAGGKCVSVSAAYEESLKKGPKGKSGIGDGKQDGFDSYEQEMFRKLAGMLKEPTTPLVKPPTALRGLVLYYPGDENELYSYRYIFFFVDGPGFVLGDYLRAGIEGDGR
jgi:conjugal transfer pilus assembly protein TraV